MHITLQHTNIIILMGQVVFKKTKEKKKEPETIFFSPILKPSDCKTKKSEENYAHSNCCEVVSKV